MKNTTILASLGLASFLLAGCCTCALKQNNCPPKHPATPIVTTATPTQQPVAVQAGVPDDAVSNDETETKPGWGVYAIAGGVIVLGLGVQFFTRKKKK